MDHSMLYLYHTFLIVAKCESISAAAKELFISQPAVSKAIKRLEDNVGFPLFNRNSRGISLTSEGSILYEYIHNAFDIISAGEENLKRIQELGIGHIHIGVSSTLCKHILLPYLKEFLHIHPHIQVTISCQSTLQTIKLLENREVDIGLIAQPQVNRKLICIPVMQLEDIFVASPQYIDNLLEREHILQEESLEKSSLILLDKKNMTRRYIETYLNSWKIDTDSAMEVNSMDLLIDFVKTGLGTGCVIKQFIEKDLENHLLIQLPTPDSIQPRQICFAHSASASLSAAGKSFINFIMKKNT